MSKEQVMPSGRRPFYSGAWAWLALGLAATLVGFWPSFFSRPSANAFPHALHGTVCTLWLVLLVVQAGLVRLRRFPWHRRIGWAGAVLMPLLLVSGAWVLHLMLGGQTRLPQALARALGFLDLVTLFFLALAYGLAMAYRRDMQVHARWMVCTLLVVLPPALARLAFVVEGSTPFPLALGLAYAIPAAAAAILAVQDWRAGRLRAAYPATLAFLAGSYLLLGTVTASPTWVRIADWIGGR